MLQVGDPYNSSNCTSVWKRTLYNIMMQEQGFLGRRQVSFPGRCWLGRLHKLKQNPHFPVHLRSFWGFVYADVGGKKLNCNCRLLMDAFLTLRHWEHEFSVEPQQEENYQTGLDSRNPKFWYQRVYMLACEEVGCDNCINLSKSVLLLYTLMQH